MSAESLSPLLIRTLSQTKAQVPAASYYRSKLFISGFSNNDLVAAASPIFSLLDRISVSATLPPIDELRKNIEHELLAFDSRLHRQLEDGSSNKVARFMLCATIDELVGKNYLRLRIHEANFKAFSTSNTAHKSPQDVFFELLSAIQEQPQLHLDALEFAYFCLISGIEGPYHNDPTGRQKLDTLLEELHQGILQHRVYRPSAEQKSPDIKLAKSQPIIQKKTLLWLGGLFLIGSIAWTHYHSLDAKVQQLRISSPLNTDLQHS